MASLCGNTFMKKIRHGCFAGSAMYSPDAYIMTKKHSQRPKKKKKGDDSYGFHQNWARDNEAMENDSFYVYDGGKKPKKPNLVESMVIEEDCSWFTPRSYQSLAKPTQIDTAKSSDKWKTPKSIGTVESKCIISKQSSSLKREKVGKQSTDTNPFCTPRPPLKDIKNRNQNSGMKPSLKTLQNQKQLPCTSSKTKVDQVRNSVTNENQNAVVTFSKKFTPFQQPQNSNPQHSNNIHKENKPLQLPVTSDHAVNSRTTRQEPDLKVDTFTKVVQDENCDPVEPSFIGIINGPKPNVVLSETVKKNNVKGRRMYCGKLTEKTALFVSEALPDVEDRQMSIDELETTKLMQEHALKEPILPSCDESVAISSHLKLTMSVATDASTMNISGVEGSKLYNSKETHQMKSSPNSTDITLDISSNSGTSLGSNLTDFTSTGSTLTDVTTVGVTLTDVNSMGSTLTDVTPMSISSANSSTGSLLKVTNTSSSKEICLPSYVSDDSQTCKTKYYSPTLAQLKMRKQRSVAKLVKAFEDCKVTSTNIFDELVPTMASTQKQIDGKAIPDDDKQNEDINVITIHEKSQLLSPIFTSQKDLKCESKNICDNSMKTEKLEIGIDKNIMKANCNEKGIRSSECTAIPSVSKSGLFDYDTILQTKPRVKQENSESKSFPKESMGNKNTKKCAKRKTGSNKPPEKLSLLWTASMLDDYRSKDFSVGQGTDVIIMNEEDPKWLYVQIATAVNGKVKLKQKTAGFVPRSLVLPRFASPATRSTYRSLDSRKKSKNVCGHGLQILSQKLPFDSIDTLQTPPKIKTSRHLVKHDDYKLIQHSQSFPMVSLIESYIVLKDHKPIEKDEVEVLAGEVIVVHARQQRELDWMWVYVPRAEKFGYIPAFCATPMALDFQNHTK